MIWLLLLVLAAPLEATTISTDAPGEMGPAMLIVQENNTAAQTDYDQTLQLHKGWNLVSWHIKPLEPDIYFPQILPLNEPEPPYNPTWFNTLNGELYMWTSRTLHWPYDYQNDAWILDYAYYMLLDAAHNWDEFENKPRFALDPMTGIDPSPAWDSNQLDPNNLAREWFFMGYAAPGYCKLASLHNTDTPQPPSGDPQYFDYEGPFHDLVWQGASPYRLYDLKLVRDDQGKFYVPDPDPQNHLEWPIDQIGMLQPGKGYFLGFAADLNETYDFEGWGQWPQWQNDEFGGSGIVAYPQINAASHFQYNAYTHWAYPVIIDTVDLEQCAMVAGDQIGVYDGNLCVGAAVCPDSFPLVITCWEDDIATPSQLDGYLWNNPMTFIWYDVSENAEIEFQLPPGTQAVADDPIAPTHSGFGRGFFARRSFTNGNSSVNQLPQQFLVHQNFPNPFNAETVIPLELPQRSIVKLEIFNLKGQLLGIPYEETYDGGWPKIRWNAAKLSSGIYFYRITAEGLERGGKFDDVGKMLVLK